MYTTQPSAYTGGGNLYIGGWVVSLSVVSSFAWWTCSVLTSLLFFFRVLAVFKRSRTKKVVFSVLWGLIGCVDLPLLYLVTVPAMPASVCQRYLQESQPISTTTCPERPSLAMFLLILMAAHHILVFIFISHELLGNNTLAGVCNMRNMITGNGLLPMSKSLLRSGQLYVRQVAVLFSLTELLTLLVSASVGLVFVTIFIYWKGSGWWILWSGMYPAAECILSCRVFRTLLLSERRLGESSGVVRTRDVEEMVMAAIARANDASDPERSF